MGLEQNEEEARKYWEKAADGGYVRAWHDLGFTEMRRDSGCIEDALSDVVAGMRHFRLSALGGHRFSVDTLIGWFEEGYLRHEDLAETVQAFYRARSEMKSGDRDQYIAHLKRTGKYKKCYDY